METAVVEEASAAGAEHCEAAAIKTVEVIAMALPLPQL